MKKIFLLGIILILLIIVGIFIFNRDRDRDRDIVRFKYSYGSQGWTIYEIYKENGKTYIRNGGGLNIDKEIDNSILKDISNIVQKNKIYKWNGFHRQDKILSDGYGFSLSIEYDNGEKIEANGYGYYPANYRKGHEILSNYLENIK